MCSKRVVAVSDTEKNDSDSISVPGLGMSQSLPFTEINNDNTNPLEKLLTKTVVADTT